MRHCHANRFSSSSSSSIPRLARFNSRYSCRHGPLRTVIIRRRACLFAQRKLFIGRSEISLRLSGEKPISRSGKSCRKLQHCGTRIFVSFRDSQSEKPRAYVDLDKSSGLQFSIFLSLFLCIIDRIRNIVRCLLRAFSYRRVTHDIHRRIAFLIRHRRK